VEGQQVPKAFANVVAASVEQAVLRGDLWLVAGPTSLWKEAVPAGVLTDMADLLPPPEPIVAAAILEANIPEAWNGDRASVAGILSQLSTQRGTPVPWPLLAQAVDGALRSRLVELASDSAPWPCDSSAAPKVVLKSVVGGGGAVGGGGVSTVDDKMIALRAYLKPNEIQDLADNLTDIMNLQVKYAVTIRLHLAVEAVADGEMKPEFSSEIRKLLDDISEAFI